MRLKKSGTVILAVSWFFDLVNKIYMGGTNPCTNNGKEMPDASEDQQR